MEHWLLLLWCVEQSGDSSVVCLQMSAFFCSSMDPRLLQIQISVGFKSVGHDGVQLVTGWRNWQLGFHEASAS